MPKTEAPLPCPDIPCPGAQGDEEAPCFWVRMGWHPTAVVLAEMEHSLVHVASPGRCAAEHPGALPQDAEYLPHLLLLEMALLVAQS